MKPTLLTPRNFEKSYSPIGSQTTRNYRNKQKHLSRLEICTTFSPSKSQNNTPLFINKKSSHHRTASESGQFFKTEINLTDRSKQFLDKVINDCNKVQSKLVKCWEDVQTTITRRAQSIDFEEPKEKWMSEFQYLNAKRKAEANVKHLSEQADAEKYRKVKSIISSSPLTRTISQPIFQNKREYISREDLVNIDTAKLLSSNKREFGKQFENEIKFPNWLKDINNFKPRKFDICPEETVLADIKAYQLQDKQLKPKKIKIFPIMKDIEPKVDEDFILDKFKKATQVHKRAIEELLKLKPKDKNNINKKKRKILEHKLKKYNDALKQMEDEQKCEENRPRSVVKFDMIFPRRVTDMPGYLTTKRNSQEDEELLSIIRHEKIDVKTMTKIQKIMNEREHKKLIKLV